MPLSILKIGDTLYLVVRQMIEHEDINIEHFKEQTYSTNVFRKDGMLWFCQEIEEIEIDD